MTYGYMRVYEDRVRRAVNTPDRNGRFALWQGGMEPNIPVGSRGGRRRRAWRARSPAPSASSARARAASGSRTGRWCTSSGRCGRRSGSANQLGRAFPRLTYTQSDADGLLQLEPAPRTIRGARDLISVALQYGNAFGRGFQAAALKPADFFGNDDVLYLMEDMATGEIRLSILWEWVHKGARLTAADRGVGVERGRRVHARAVPAADRRGVRQAPARRQPRRARRLEGARRCRSRGRSSRPTSRTPVKAPWYVDLLNINLGVADVATARARIARYMEAFAADGSRITENLDFA